MSAPLSRIAASARPGIVECLKSGVETVDAMVERLYVGLNPALRRAAGRSVLAHLIDLIGRDIVAADGPPTVAAHYRLRHSAGSGGAAAG